MRSVADSTRALTAGEKLPPSAVRRCHAGIALDRRRSLHRLAAEGVIRSRRGSGFYISGAKSPLRCRSRAAVDLRRPILGSRQSLDASLRAQARMRLAPCRLDAERRPSPRHPQPGRADDPILAEYGNTRGRSPCADCLSQFAGKDRGGADGPPTFVGHAGDRPDLPLPAATRDTVLVDDPCYFNFQALLRAHRAKVVSVPYTPTGPASQCWPRLLGTHRPRLYIHQFALHNPTGATISPQTAHKG